jgi:hypothetical protein
MKTVNILRVLAFLAALVSPIASAWDGAVTAAPGQIDITSGGNYGFRVFLQSFPAMCGNQNDWAYLNSSDSNYSTYVAAILMARAQGTNVTIYSDRDANGYCRIGYVSVRYP